MSKQPERADSGNGGTDVETDRLRRGVEATAEFGAWTSGHADRADA